MKNLLVLALLVVFSSIGYSQTKFMKFNDKTITTARDTTVLNSQNSDIVYEIYITNRSSSDTLYFRFNTVRGTAQDTTWSYLFPLQSVHFNNIIAKYVFRKTLRNSVFSQLGAN